MYFFINNNPMDVKKISLKLLLALLIGAFVNTTHAQNINTPNKSGPMGTQVNTLTGNLNIPRNDLYIPGRGFDLNVSFYYNSYNFEQNSGFGNGWEFGYDIKYKNDTANSKTIIWGDGREDNYTPLPGITYKSPKGFFDTLTQYQPNKYVLSIQDGTKYYFDNSTIKKITKMQERNGNYINFNYTDSLLTSVVNTAGQTITFTYNSTGKLATVVDAVAAPTRTWAYTYDAIGNLKQVTDPLGGAYKYSYLINGPMKTMSDKNNNTIDIIYYPDYSTSEIIGCNKRVSFSYDTTVNKTIVTDYVPTGSNQVTTYGYSKINGQAWLTSLTANCCGYNMTFEFDANGNKIKQTDANGNITTYTYDAKGNILTMKDALNQTIAYTYSAAFNNVTSFTDAKGFVTTMAYNSNGDLIQLTEPGNLIYTATYNSNGDILSSTDPKGNTFTYTYDAYGNPVIATGPNGYHANLSVDPRGNLLSFTDALGNSSNIEYDILNRLKKLTDPINNNVQLTYDAVGNLTSIKDQNNETSQFNYDASNRPVKYTDAINNKSYFSYDAMNNPITINDAGGNTTSFTYDTRNRLSGAKDALQNNSAISYDANGNILSINLPNGQRLSYTYDKLDRVISVSDLTGAIANLTYDGNNNVTSFTNGTGAVSTATYDSLNRVKQITDPLGNSALLTYDQNNNIVSVKDRNGFIKTYTYDSLNRVKTYTDNNGSVITANYDAEGNIVSVNDQNNNTTNYTYDNLNRLSKITYPDAKFIQYTYDSRSNIIARRLTDGTSINFGYDSLNRVISKILPGGNAFTYSYDALSRVITASNNNGTVFITYDALDRVSSETFNGRLIRYNYNIAGRTQTIIYPDSTTITKTFDTRNRLIGIAEGNNTVAAYQYNNANQVTTKTFANGVITNLQYDFANRLSNVSTAGGSIQNTAFTYDKEGNKTSINRLNNPALSEQFVYDNGYRITNYKRGVIGGTPTIQNTYSFDAVGNRTSANLNGTNTVYTHNNLNQLTNSNNGTQNINFTYDNNGNLTYDGAFYKTYDAEGRLIKDSASTTNKLSYVYDVLERRMQKNNNGTIYNYTFSGFSQIEERDAIGQIRNKTIFADFITPIVNKKDGSNYYYHQNELNSVEAISNDVGRTMEQYQYDVYGKQIIYDSTGNILPGSITGNHFGYTGQMYDSATASNKFLFREYNATTGRFNGRDPIGYGDGMGMYQYTHNNPANGIDLLGLNDCDPAAPDKDLGDHIVDLNNSTPQWWLSNIASNINSITTATQSSMLNQNWNNMVNLAEKIAGTTRATHKLNLMNNLKALVNERSAILNNPIFKGLNGNIAGGILAPVNILSAIGGTIDTYRNWGNMSGAQKTEAGIGLGGSYAFAGGSTAQIVNGINAVRAGGTFASGFGTTLTASAGGTLLVAASGGIAIEQLVNMGAKKFTGGKGLSDVGYEYEIPVVSGLFRKFNGGEYNDPIVPPASRDNHWKPTPVNCPQNGKPGGTRIKPHWEYLPNGDSVLAIGPKDPNQIIGPDGQPGRQWVSVHDRLPYTILYENDKTASAPAKFVRVTSPIEPKQDAATFQLGNFGFNNQTFAVPANTASYYQRLDARDSLGLYVDLTAGYDQINNVAFWEFQSIDPLTLLPPSDPLKGFLLLQDSSKPLNGHGFVNFSIKPIQSALTLDTIGAKAAIVFDFNDTIPTNIAKNTIDAFPPTSHMNAITSPAPDSMKLSWTGVDDAGGCGINYFTIYVSNDHVNYSILIPKITRFDTTINLLADTNYCFFVLATDRVGNREILRPGEIQCFTLGPSVPVSWLYFRGKTVAKDNILDWATANEQNSKQFDVERSLNSISFSRIGIVNAAGNSNQTNTYQYKDLNIDRLNSNVMFYRLKQVDISGNFKYSNIVRLSYNAQHTVNSIVYPNPTQGQVTILVGDNSLVGTVAVIYDVNGRLLENIKIASSSQAIDLSNYVNGIYFIKLSNNEVLKVEKL